MFDPPQTKVAPLTDYAPPLQQQLPLLYEDDCFLILDKPSGLLTVPGRGDEKYDSLATRVQLEFPDALIVHRLDMETSGVVLMARGKEMQRHFNELFEQRKVQKRYIAIVAGRMTESNGLIDFPLRCDWPNRPRQIVDHEQGKPSLTHYKVLWRNIEEDTTRVELAPETGRSHQLRVHLASIGHPILGDQLYADAAARHKAERLMLHAQSLAFIHPRTGEPMRMISPPPF